MARRSRPAASGLLRLADGRWKTDRQPGVAKLKPASIAVQREALGELE
jgi:hypothetical protein